MPTLPDALISNWFGAVETKSVPVLSAQTKAPLWLAFAR